MIVRRVIGQNLLFTRYLLERDYLSACITRLGSGFTPPSEFVNARLHYENIKWILDELDRIKDVPKDGDVKIKDFMSSQRLQ
jgi:hypothetical protein